MAESTVVAVRSGRWREVAVGPFEAAVAVAALADLATTTYVLTTGRGEANVVLAGLARVHPLLAVGAFWAFGALLVGICWLRFGWLSRVAGVYTLVSLGVTGTNNVLLYAFGVDLLAGGVTWYIHYGAPALGVSLGAAWLAPDDDVPWREVVAVGGAFLAAAWLLPLAF